MTRSIRYLASLALVACVLAQPAAAGVVSGVNVPDSVQADGKALRLQGAGLRKKTFVSVYVGALYLTTPTGDAAVATRADEPKRIALTFLRDVGASSLREAFDEGFANNSKERLSVLKPRIDAFLKLAAVDMRNGQELSFTYLPGVGTRVAVAGVPRGTVEGKDFMEAVWAIWLGDVPPSPELKKGMLGPKN